MVKPLRIGLYGLTAVALIGIGAAIGAAGSSGATGASPAPTVTVTKAVPGPTVTDNVPGPTITVRAKATHAGATMPGDGTFIVGYASGDWRPGTWQSGAPASGNCYSATLSNLSGTGDSSGIINNNNSAGPSVITVSSSAVGVEVSGCETWHKVG